jgi:hypothetical protein
MARNGESAEWEILLTTEVAAFLDELYESDPASHQLVNQTILVLERTGPAEGSGRGRRAAAGLRQLAGCGAD